MFYSPAVLSHVGYSVPTVECRIQPQTCGASTYSKWRTSCNTPSLFGVHTRYRTFIIQSMHKISFQASHAFVRWSHSPFYMHDVRACGREDPTNCRVWGRDVRRPQTCRRESNEVSSLLALSVCPPPPSLARCIPGLFSATTATYCLYTVVVPCDACSAALFSQEREEGSLVVKRIAGVVAFPRARPRRGRSRRPGQRPHKTTDRGTRCPLIEEAASDEAGGNYIYDL